MSFPLSLSSIESAVNPDNDGCQYAYQVNNWANNSDVDAKIRGQQLRLWFTNPLTEEQQAVVCAKLNELKAHCRQWGDYIVTPQPFVKFFDPENGPFKSDLVKFEGFEVINPSATYIPNTPNSRSAAARTASSGSIPISRYAAQVPNSSAAETARHYSRSELSRLVAQAAQVLQAYHAPTPTLRTAPIAPSVSAAAPTYTTQLYFGGGVDNGVAALSRPFEQSIPHFVEDENTDMPTAATDTGPSAADIGYHGAPEVFQTPLQPRRNTGSTAIPSDPRTELVHDDQSSVYVNQAGTSQRPEYLFGGGNA
jgi:hypothetical protein